MLRIIQVDNAVAAKKYYERDDYYSRGGEQELVGSWGGRGAARLGLAGAVEQKAFAALCDNRHPATATTLTQRQKERRRVGWDINMHCPKGVSVIYGITHDERILDAFRESVRLTMEEMEKDIRVRVRSRGRDEERVSAEGVWGEFVHLTSRPVGGMPDPQLHAHCFLFNASFDETESRWKAATVHVLKEDAPYFEALFRHHLARGLVKRGFHIERNAKGFDLAGVPESVKEKFSRRTAEIEATAERLGITDPKEKDQLGKRTRAKKADTLPMDELRRQWLRELTPDERKALLAVHRGQTAGRRKETTAREAIDYATLKSYERSSVVKERKILEEALRYGVGSVKVEELRGELGGPGWIVREMDGERLVTTASVLAEEMRMTEFAKSGKGTCRPLAPDDPSRFVANLNRDQAQAVRQVLGSQDRVIVLRGAAGVGKTTMLRGVVASIEASGRRVVAVAPSASASRGTMRAEGYKDADTIASLLQSEQRQSALAGGNAVLLVDEAGLVCVRDMERLLDLADRSGARVILSGDTAQHQSPGRGDALRVLQEQAGLPAAEVRTIVRQRASDYREAVKALSTGDAAAGFQQLDRMGCVKEIAGDEERHAAAAKEFVGLTGKGTSVLLVAPTHAEGKQATAAIRKALKEEGRVGTDERVFRVLSSDSPTEAERRDAVRDTTGQVIEVHQNAKGFRRGSRAYVTGQDDAGRVLVKKDDGQLAVLPLGHADRFQVYTAGDLPVAPGDKLRITANGQTADKKHRLNRGDVHRVAGFTDTGDIRLDNGWVLAKGFGHLAHGYAVTSHAAQGRTTDHVIVVEGTKSLAAASQEQLYVSASRGRDGVSIFTDDKQELLRAVQRSGQRLSAQELVKGARAESPARSKWRDHAERLQRSFSLAKAYASQKIQDFSERYVKMRDRQREKERS